MLADIIHLIKSDLEATGLFNMVYPLVRIVTDGINEYPAHYTGGGNYEHLVYDASMGMAYFRRNGKVHLADVTKQYAITSCPDGIYEISTPLRLVALIPKNKAVCDDEFADEYFAQRIITEVTNLKAEYLNAISAKVVSTGFETDTLQVIQSEKLEVTDINYNWSYLYVDFLFTIVIDKNCLYPCDYAYN